MTKRLQNKVAESRLTLPVTIAYSVAVWLMAGLIKENWWIQFSCFLISVFLILILNNENVLIRVYSRSVSATYAVLTCMAVSLLPSVQGAIIKLLAIVSLLILYKCYQDKSSPGLNFYAFLLDNDAGFHIFFQHPYFHRITYWSHHTLLVFGGMVFLLER